MKDKLKDIYAKLFSAFGRQYWWPADSSFEVMVGAILTQNTNWLNVEKAIQQLKKNKVLSAENLRRISERKLASLIRPAGYYNVKAKRLKNLVRFLYNNYGCNLSRMRKRDVRSLRNELLQVNGIGQESADSILLYALEKPVFVIDAYTKRILTRHGLIKEGATYQEAQNLFMKTFKKDVELFNEFHALLVKTGKDYCSKNKQKCSTCPLGHD